MNQTWLGTELLDSEDSDDDFVPNGAEPVDTSEPSADESSDKESYIGSADHSADSNVDNIADHHTSSAPTSPRSTPTRGSTRRMPSSRHALRSRTNHDNSDEPEEVPIPKHTHQNCSSPSVGFFAPTDPLKKILIPFPVFSDVFNKFHEEQEQEFKTVVQYERNLAVKKEEMAEHSDNLRRMVDKKRSEMREIQEDISHMRAKLESLHEKMVPVFNTLLADDNQLNEYNVSSFAMAFAKKLNKDSG